jgi:hypothetical protein
MAQVDQRANLIVELVDSLAHIYARHNLTRMRDLGSL